MEALVDRLAAVLADRLAVMLAVRLTVPLVDRLTVPLVDRLAVPLTHSGSMGSAPPLGVQTKGLPLSPAPGWHTCKDAPPPATMEAGQESKRACPPSSAGDATPPSPVGDANGAPAPPAHAILAVKSPHCAFAPVP